MARIGPACAQHILGLLTGIPGWLKDASCGHIVWPPDKCSEIRSEPC